MNIFFDDITFGQTTSNRQANASWFNFFCQRLTQIAAIRSEVLDFEEGLFF